MKKQCAGCQHFEKFSGMSKGYCWAMPPTIFASGGQTHAPPEVKESRQACHFFTALPEGQQPAIKEKTNLETPGDAAKLARAEKNFGKKSLQLKQAIR